MNFSVDLLTIWESLATCYLCLYRTTLDSESIVRKKFIDNSSDVSFECKKLKIRDFLVLQSAIVNRTNPIPKNLSIFWSSRTILNEHRHFVFDLFYQVFFQNIFFVEKFWGTIMLFAFLASEIWQTKLPRIFKISNFFCSLKTSSKANACLLTRHISIDSLPPLKGYPIDLEQILHPALRK